MTDIIEECARAERVVAAAVRRNGLVYSMPAPARHHHILVAICANHGDGRDEVIEAEEQGFITDTGRFVGRTEGKVLARNAGQLLERASKSSHLFSEDLW